jgi:hypothetical protein
MTVVRWFFAAIAFAGTLGLAIHTAAVGASNVQSRARIQRIDELRRSLALRRYDLEARWREDTAGDRLHALVRETLGEEAERLVEGEPGWPGGADR